MTFTQFIDELTYVNYAHNRQISPSVSVERWQKVYGPNTEAMERRYSGTLISDLCETVAKLTDLPEHMPGMCGRCFNYREHSRDLPDGGYEMVDCLECVL